MARISGMIWGLGLLIVISQFTTPASAWDHDDDDGYFKHNRRRCYCAPIVRQPVYGPNPYAAQPYYSPGYGFPQQQPAPIPQQPVSQQPIVPPLPASSFPQDYPAYPPATVNPPSATPPAQPTSPVSLAPQQPGQFMEQAVPLYPYVRVKDANKVPGFAVQKILAVASPDPFRFPGLVYVQVSVPPVPCQGVKIKDRGAKTVLSYGEFEVEVTSSQGLVTIDYDD